MNESFRLGRIAGVPVGAHWSVLVVLGLIAFGLSAGRLPQVAPGASPALYLGVGVVTALVFLACLLAHEVSHAVLAQRNGVGVRGITLWLFGGVAQLRGDPATPGADARIAGVGPLVSLGLGGLFLVLSAAVVTAGGSGVAVAALGWLGVINLVLAVFNLIPAAPLDGGRLLRAGIWRVTGDRRRAAVSAARAGRALGLVLIVLGLAQVVLARGFGGLWIALIGWFVVAAARAEEEAAGRDETLAGIPVGQVMTADPVTVAPDLTVEDFVEEHLLHGRHASFPLRDAAGGFAGLVTLNRVREVPAGERAATRLAAIACRPAEVPVAAADEDLADLLPRMQGCADGRAVVLDASRRVLGIVAPSDISRLTHRAELR